MNGYEWCNDVVQSEAPSVLAALQNHLLFTVIGHVAWKYTRDPRHVDLWKFWKLVGQRGST